MRTYTHAIEELERGHLPDWYADFRASLRRHGKLTELLGIREHKDAPSIAKDYWRLDENATIKDVLYVVRSDETSHRFVNHSLGNLEDTDVNPFAIREPDMHTKGKNIEYILRSFLTDR